MKKGTSAFSIFIVTIFVLTGCVESEYTRLVKRELERGIIEDSLFLNFRFGQTRTEFYETGWKVNRTGKIVHGPKNRTVRYRMESDNPAVLSIDMLFFPDFDENERIKNMDLTFQYTTWAIGHPRFHQDSLLQAARDTLMDWYGGNDFLLTQFETDPKEVWVKVDGNRRITLTKGPERDMEVIGVVADLSNPAIMIKNKR